MASLICCADGNWLDAATWAVSATGTGAVLIGANPTNFTAVSTDTYTQSSAFTITNNEVLDGLLLIGYRSGTTGTITVGLSDDGGSTWAREVTANLSDLPTQSPGSWVFFKFGSTLTADGGNDYKIGIKTSAGSSGVNFRNDNATAGNWTRVPRTTTTAAPGAGDNLYVAKEWTAAATGTAHSVTMNALAASITDHGTLDIGQSSDVTFGATAATNYYLRLSGDLNVWDMGTLNMGTVATPMPSNSTAILNLDCGSNVQYGVIIQNGGTFVAQGATKTVNCLLNANAAANATTLTTDVSTSWKDNDEIAVASTTRTNTECEKGTLNGDASGTTLTVDGFAGAGGGVAYAHFGTSPAQAEIVNLTRNVQIFGASASNQSYVNVNPAATVNWDYLELYWMGSNTAEKYGVSIQTNTGSFNMAYCSFHDWIVGGSTIRMYNASNNASNTTIDHCVAFKIDYGFFHNIATSGTWTCTDNVFIYNVQNYGIELLDVGGTLSGTLAGCVVAILFNEQNPAGTIGDLVVHSCSNIGIQLPNLTWYWKAQSVKCWRNSNVGISLANTAKSYVIIDSAIFFGNVDTGIYTDSPVGQLYIGSGSFNGDSSFSTNYGIRTGASTAQMNVQINNCTFGQASGILTAHGVSDIALSNGSTVIGKFNNCKFAVTPVISSAWGSIFHYQRFNQTDGDHRTQYSQEGLIQTDAAIFNTAAPSERLTPASTFIKLESGRKRKPVANGATATFSVFVRKSVVGDGTAYSGNQPRLILKANPAVGIAADGVLDTATAASDGAFEELTGTSPAVTDDAVLEAVVDCDFGGTSGWVNVDSWS